MRTSRASDYTLLLLCAGTALATAAVLAYWIVRPKFLADPSASHVSLTVGTVVAALLFGLFNARMLVRRTFGPSTLALSVCVSVLMGFIWLLAAKERAFYVLHLAANKQHSEKTEVASPTSWSKPCNYGRLDFPSLALTARFVCGVPHEVPAAMSRQGLVRLSGQASRFGMTVESLRVAERR